MKSEETQEVGWGMGRPRGEWTHLRGGESHTAHLGEIHPVTNPQRHRGLNTVKHRAGIGYFYLFIFYYMLLTFHITMASQTFKD